MEYIQEGDFIGIRGRLDANNLDGKLERKLMSNSISLLFSKNIEKIEKKDEDYER